MMTHELSNVPRNPACKVKPRRGERMCEYCERLAGELLRRVGANEAEVADFADVVYARNGYGVFTMTPDDAACMLADWREDRRRTAALIREDRRARLQAGYFCAHDVSDPVYLNGRTPW